MGAAAGMPSTGTTPDEDTLARMRRMWPPGSKCKIHSLKSAAGQHLNGLEAEVREVDEATGRLILRLQPGDELSKWKKVKPENVYWEGVTFTCEGEHSGLIEEVRALVCQAAGCPQAIEATLITELQQKLREAGTKLSPEVFATLQSFAEQARSHSCQWLMYHELRVKPDIKFDQHGQLGMAVTKETDTKEQVASSIKRSYWDVARAELAKPEPDFSFLLSRVGELVETMSGFLPVARRAVFKERAVDMSMLRMQVDNKAFDHTSLMELVHRLGAALMELESPYQSARTQEWLDELDTHQTADVVSCLAHLFEKCDILRMEVENVGLQQVKATKLRELENDIFTRMTQHDILSLEVTKSWLAASEHGGNVEIAVIKSMAKLLVDKDAIRAERCPEPLRCDLQCLQDFQSGLQGVALLGLVAIVASPFFPASTVVDDAKALFDGVAAETEKSCPQLDAICKAVEDGLADLRHSKGEAPVDFKKLDAALQTLRNCLGEDVPAFRLLHDRACGALVTALGPPRQLVLPASLGHTPWSLRYAADHLNLLVEKVWAFLGEHLRVYRPVYSKVLSAITDAASS